VKVYFCPRCGQSYDSSECIDQGSLLRCPQCPGSRVMMTGRTFTGLGLIIAFLSSFVFSPYPYVIVPGIMVGGGLVLTGLVRSLRQRRARRRFDDDEDSFEEL